MKLTTHLELVSTLSVRGAKPHFPLYVFVASTSKNVPFFVTCTCHYHHHVHEGLGVFPVP